MSFKPFEFEHSNNKSNYTFKIITYVDVYDLRPLHSYHSYNIPVKFASNRTKSPLA